MPCHMWRMNRESATSSRLCMCVCVCCLLCVAKWCCALYAWNVRIRNDRITQIQLNNSRLCVILYVSSGNDKTSFFTMCRTYTQLTTNSYVNNEAVHKFYIFFSF